MDHKFKEMMVAAICQRYVNDSQVDEGRMQAESAALLRAVDLIDRGYIDPCPVGSHGGIGSHLRRISVTDQEKVLSKSIQAIVAEYPFDIALQALSIATGQIELNQSEQAGALIFHPEDAENS